MTAQHAVWRAWEVDADKVCFGALTKAAANKVRKRSPQAVTHIIFSAGGALRPCDNGLLPNPELQRATLDARRAQQLVPTILLGLGSAFAG